MAIALMSSKRCLSSLAFLLTLSGLALLPGCTTFTRGLQPPTVELQSLGVSEPSLTAITVLFGLRVNNPNDFKLRVRHLTYQVALNHKAFGDGEVTKPVTLAAADKTFVEIPVRVSYATLFDSFQGLSGAKNVPYDLKGKVEVSGYEVPYDLSGQLNLPSAE